MKLKTVLLSLIILPLAVLAQKPDSASHAVVQPIADTGVHQNGIKKQIIINAGFAWSSNIVTIMSYIHGANPDAGYGASGPTSFKAGASYCLAADYGVWRRTTVGIALSYIQVTGTYDSLGITEKFSRLNIGARLLYHLTKNSTRKDWYFGIRWGLSVWTDKLPPMQGAVEYPFPYEPYFSPTSPVEPSLQILLGWRRFFTYGFGIHAEVGVGSPYFFEVGLTLRFATHIK